MTPENLDEIHDIASELELATTKAHYLLQTLDGVVNDRLTAYARSLLKTLSPLRKRLDQVSGQLVYGVVVASEQNSRNMLNASLAGAALATGDKELAKAVVEMTSQDRGP